MSARPRILFVEDDPDWREYARRLLEDPGPACFESDFGGFRVELAGCVEAALSKMKEAFDEDDPYEAVLLDLGLPLTQADQESGLATIQNGLRLLSDIISFYDVAVVILTVYDQQQLFVLKALRQGAFDYFGKKEFETTQGKADVFARMVMAVGKTRESLFHQLQLQRMHWLAEHSAKGLREDLTALVSKGADQVSCELDELSRLLEHDFGLSCKRDAEDAVCRQLAAVKESVAQFPKLLTDEDPEAAERVRLEWLDVAEELVCKVARVRPCYLHRDVSLIWSPPPPGSTRTRTFKSDLRLMLDELVVGSLESAPPKSAVTLSCSSSKEDRSLTIRVTRAAPEFAESAVPGERGRHCRESAEEGLRFLRRIADNMGARLEEQTRGQDAVLTVRIRVMDHAKSRRR